MLNPEVWDFKPPSSNSLFKVDSSSNSIECKHPFLLEKHYFNHSVSVLLPDTLLVPESLNKALSDNCDYYKLNDVPIQQFINAEFIDAFVKSGEITALSIGSNIDTDNCAAVTPCGHLVLSLLQETYQELGLEGKPSTLSKKISRFAME